MKRRIWSSDWISVWHVIQEVSSSIYLHEFQTKKAGGGGEGGRWVGGVRRSLAQNVANTAPNAHNCNVWSFFNLSAWKQYIRQLGQGRSKEGSPGVWSGFSFEIYLPTLALLLFFQMWRLWRVCVVDNMYLQLICIRRPRPYQLSFESNRQNVSSVHRSLYSSFVLDHDWSIMHGAKKIILNPLDSAK